MLVKHKAIVLHSIPYGENSKVVKCFTDNLGLQSYLVNGVSNKKGVLKPSMVMPLTQLSIIAYHKGKGGLERIKEARLESSYQSIPIDPMRNALAIFVSEVLGKVCQEEQANHPLYSFLEMQLNLLDASETPLGFFHLTFLIELSSFLGFKPSLPLVEVQYFDMMEGTFEMSKPLHAHYLSKEETTLMCDLLRGNASLKTDKDIRLSLLDKLLDYYKIQLDGFGEVKSLEIIKVLF
jgi:DNA repair protein RecO (recombination protein O)